MKRALEDDLKVCSPLTDLFLLFFLTIYLYLTCALECPEHSIIIWGKRGSPPRDPTRGIDLDLGINIYANTGNAHILPNRGDSASKSIDSITVSTGVGTSQ